MALTIAQATDSSYTTGSIRPQISYPICFTFVRAYLGARQYLSPIFALLLAVSLQFTADKPVGTS